VRHSGAISAVKSSPSRRYASRACASKRRKRWDKHVVEKGRELGDVMLDRFELGVAVARYGHMISQAGDAGFGGLADLQPGRRASDRGVEGDLEGCELGNTSVSVTASTGYARRSR